MHDELNKEKIAESILLTRVINSNKELYLFRNIYAKALTGTGHIYLNTSTNDFDAWWLNNLHSINIILKKYFRFLFQAKDILISLKHNHISLSGPSAGLPLFLIIYSSLTGKKIPENIFSTGGLLFPDGFLSYSHDDNMLRKKAKTVIFYAQNKGITNPVFLVPKGKFSLTVPGIKIIRINHLYEALQIVFNQIDYGLKKFFFSFDNLYYPLDLKENTKIDTNIVIVHNSPDENELYYQEYIYNSIKIIESNHKFKFKLTCLFIIINNQIIYKETIRFIKTQKDMVYQSINNLISIIKEKKNAIK